MMADRLWTLVRDTRRVRAEGQPAVAARQRTRLAEIAAFARTHSPLYRDLLHRAPEQITDSTQLPVTNKKLLMSRFSEWATDREITIERAREFVGDSSRIGEKFLDRYLAVTTSGTTGIPGIFVVDDRTLRVTNALALRMLSDWLTASDVLRIAAGRGRMAMIMATGGHYASSVASARLRKRLGRMLQVLSVHTPLTDLVNELNRFRPVLLAPYASLASQLASEQEAGRLQIQPMLLTLSAEGLPAAEYDRIANVFGAKVGNSYAASECMFLSYDCSERWLHVNADWVVVEPVNADYSPTPPGEQSHTVLITNLANRTQPILRYDLGDSILQRPDPCPCGNPLPAIRPKGRTADVLTFPSLRGGPIKVPLLAFGADVPGVEQFQIVQTAPTTLHVRLRVDADADRERVWEAVRAEITRVLAANGLEHVTVQRADDPPQQTAGGKYREIIPFSAADPNE
jgi:phenylacetate-coenzyme A ligase PaaK-like adenylate-forming protein